MPKNARANRSEFRPAGHKREIATIRMPGYAGMLFAYINDQDGPMSAYVRIRDRDGTYYLEAAVYDRKQAVDCVDAWMSDPNAGGLTARPAFAGARGITHTPFNQPVFSDPRRPLAQQGR